MKWHRPKITWQSKSPTNADEEYSRLEGFYKQEMKRSPDTSADLTRWQWQKALERYIETGWPISIVTLDRIWEKLTQHDMETDPPLSEKVSGPFARNAVDSLFDFSTTAITHQGQETSRHTRRGYQSQEKRKPPGMDLQQRVFLADIQTRFVQPEPNPKPGELDKFAMAIADLEGYDGVYCLSGVRGSGKSSILNRIAWYCHHWFDRTQKPLLVRFDLGTVFERGVFLRDLLAEICLATKKTLRQPPYSLPYGPDGLIRAVGHLGRFCHINVPWATIAAVFLVVLIGSTYQSDSTNGGTYLSFIVKSAEENQKVSTPIFGWNLSDARMVLCGLLGFVVLGIAYFMYQMRVKIFSFIQREGRKSSMYRIVFFSNLVVLTSVLGVLFEIFTREPSLWLTGVFSLQTNGGTLSFIVCIIGLSIGILSLPRWWECYLLMNRILSRVRSEPAQRFMDMPLLAPMGSVSWYLTRLLPSSESPDQLDKISEPFVQELIKQALHECSLAFRRTVILVDDIDALPSSEFHSVMRLLRPMSKVSGVRCILATPLFFHFVLGDENFSDVHSTVRTSIVVGNPTIFRDWPQRPDKLTESRKFLREFLIDLVVSRLRMNLRDDYHGRRAEVSKLILQSPAFKFVLDPWMREDDTFILELFTRFGTSRREIIRVMDEALKPSLRDMSNTKARVNVMKKYGNALNRLKSQYRDQEDILNCNSSSQPTKSSPSRSKRTTGQTRHS